MRARSTARRVLATAAAIAVVLGLAACAPERTVAIDVPTQVEAKLPADTQKALQSAVTDAMAAAGASGAIVGVWAPWSGTWVAGLGTQEVGGGAKVTTDMSFRAADETRPMICDVLYQVAAKGTVTLSDSVTRYVTGVPNLKDVTLLELCNGTSGIGSYQSQLMALWLSNPGRDWDPRELTSFGLGQPRTSTPGAAWRDSDAGYVLLGLALERATGESASQLLHDYVFAPLALSSTTLGSRSISAEAHTVLDGYHSMKGDDGVMQCTKPLQATDVSTSTGFTASGVVSTIEDLGRYAQALASNALLPDSAHDRWAKPLILSTTSPSWLTATGGAFQAGSLIGQYGAVPGYATAAFSDPKTGMTVAVVLNNSGAGSTIAADLAFELAAITSKAPPAAGQKAVELGLPWTAEQFHDDIAKAAICPAPAS